ncbi:hypothetical protein NDU88_002035 [Pleurodeles waltl]|uniref:Uncharacterized protein n=1 Tax=Pleurodeles waltl TaxID=8319 RepID=A0AAV7P7L9_PLEWA|nr:hypothetical protein NDU88_002035 [Pleurodeles waltl]
MDIPIFVGTERAYASFKQLSAVPRASPRERDANSRQGPWELGISWESEAGSRLSVSLETETRLLHSLGNQTPARVEAAPGKRRRGCCTCYRKRFCTGCGQGKQTIKHVTLMYIKAFY